MTQVSGLTLLREPFPAHQISKLPKPTKKQTEEVRNDVKKGIRCQICGGWHHRDVVHLDYVWHAALTDRLLNCDPMWNWEPVGLTEAGTPATDANGGMWIKLTVCGVTRLGYGHSDGKKGGDAVKEVIGDALRNAAMRFGAALDLWHKGELHVSDDNEPEAPNPPEVDPQATKPESLAQESIDKASAYLFAADSLDDLKERWGKIPKNLAVHADVIAAKDEAKKNLTMPDNSDIGDDQIPY